jgi:benzodiazapine receptor
VTLGAVARLFACLVLCLGVGALGALVTTPEIPTWYAGLIKPKWTPPNWVFPVVWNILYLMMGTSLWFLWQADPQRHERRRAITLFLIQLALNAAWSLVFFKLHQTKTALAIILLLAIAVAATIITSWRVDRRTAALLVPYLVWIGYAVTLNAGIVVLNP